MEFLLFLIIGAIILFFVFRKSGNKKANDYNNANRFQQHNVIVDYDAHTITVKNKTFDVNQVTGIRINPRSAIKGVEILVDDLETPILKVNTIGMGADELFMQRLSVALRKAGGPSFI